MNLQSIEKLVQNESLSVFGALHPTLGDVPVSIQTIVLLGPKEPGFWAHFVASDEYRDKLPNPMDRWSVRVLGKLAKPLDVEVYFPFGGPPYQPFIKWAKDSRRAHISPVGLLVHDVAGLWVSYRGAFGLREKLELPDPTLSPCITCKNKPCVGSCPVNALQPETYDVAACKADLENPKKRLHAKGLRGAKGLSGEPKIWQNGKPIRLSYGSVQMTLRLILMRHAKSGWGDPTLDDHDRPLNTRGRHSAKAIGERLKRDNYIPYQLLSSSAQRTRETCALLEFNGEKSFLEALYLASPAAMSQVLKRATAPCVLMLGHNPGIAWFARELVQMPPEHPRFSDYPTCATLVVDFQIDNWADLQPGSGNVQDFVIPRELTQS